MHEVGGTFGTRVRLKSGFALVTLGGAQGGPPGQVERCERSLGVFSATIRHAIFASSARLALDRDGPLFIAMLGFNIGQCRAIPFVRTAR